MRLGAASSLASGESAIEPIIAVRTTASLMPNALAGIAARADDAITGATLLGAAEAYRDTTGAVRQPDERTGIDATVAALTERLSADALAVALERGRRTDLAAAVAVALDVRA